MCGISLWRGTRSRLTTRIVKTSKSWNKHVKGLHQLWTSYNSNMQNKVVRPSYWGVSSIIYNCCVSWLYVYIVIYTLQLRIIDLTQRGCHTLRSANVISENETNYSNSMTRRCSWVYQLLGLEYGTFYKAICIVAKVSQVLSALGKEENKLQCAWSLQRPCT